jgi:hypothetical protein
MVRTTWENKCGIYAAVIVRIALGTLLIFVAPDTKFPVFFKALGTVSIVAAVVLPWVGKDRISALMAWFERLPASGIRLYLLFGMAFGAFLVYGACT